MSNVRKTSSDAFKTLKESKSAMQRRRIYELLQNQPMTDEEILEAMGGPTLVSAPGLIARRNELLKDDRFQDMRIYDSGLTKKSRFNKPATLWTTKPQGELF